MAPQTSGHASKDPLSSLSMKVGDLVPSRHQILTYVVFAHPTNPDHPSRLFCSKVWPQACCQSSSACSSIIGQGPELKGSCYTLPWDCNLAVRQTHSC